MRQVTRKGLLTVAAASGVLAMSGGAAHADSGAQGGAEGSPGVLSGNSVQAPVDVPVNACGNSVDVVGLLNPSSGNGCENGSDGSGSSDGQDRAGSSSDRQGEGQQQAGGAQADGGASDSPGVGSGNSAQAPVEVPVNACGNTITVIGIGNTVTGNGCENDAPQESAPPQSSAPSDPGGGGQDRTGSGGGSGGQERTGAGGGGEPQRDMTPETGGSTPVHETSAVRGGSRPVEADPAPAPAGGGQQLAETGGGSQLGYAAPLGAGLMIGGYVLYRRARVVQNAARAAQR